MFVKVPPYRFSVEEELCSRFTVLALKLSGQVHTEMVKSGLEAVLVCAYGCL